MLPFRSKLARILLSHLAMTNCLYFNLLALALVMLLSVVSSAQCWQHREFESHSIKHLARSIADAGDVNSDGYVDVILGGRGVVAGAHITDPGRAKVFSGLNGSVLLEFEGKPRTSLYDYSESMGWSVDGVGDVNGDGVGDVIVGSPHYFLGRWDYGPGSFAGRAIVFSGLDGDTIYEFDGQGMDDEFGISVTGLGDVNGDGTPDVAIGAWQWSKSDLASQGLAYVFSGADGDTIYVFDGGAVPGDHTIWEAFGRCVAGPGDLNGDGYADILVGASNAGSLRRGRAYVFSGADGSVLHFFEGEAANCNFGSSVAGAGDVDGDGVSDVIIGSRWMLESGRVYVYSGATGQPIHIFNGDATSDELGYSVSGAGDMDGDGFADLLVGDPYDERVGRDAGVVHLYSGRTGRELFVFKPDRALGTYGTCVKGMGDLNRDGLPDVGIAAVYYDESATDQGRSFVYYPCRAQVDILPQSCPNVMDHRMVRDIRRPRFANTKPPGLEIAFLGDLGFDVTDIDPSTSLLEGLTPIHWRYEDVSSGVPTTECDCSGYGPDGIPDLVLTFPTEEFLETFSTGGDNEYIRLSLTAFSWDGTPLIGQDCLTILRGEAGLIGTLAGDIPSRDALLGNTPNPFNAATTINFQTGQNGPVTLRVYDVLGRLVVTLVDDELPAGSHSEIWDGTDGRNRSVSTGIYFARLQVGDRQCTSKMVLLK